MTTARGSTANASAGGLVWLLAAPIAPGALWARHPAPAAAVRRVNASVE